MRGAAIASAVVLIPLGVAVLLYRAAMRQSDISAGAGMLELAAFFVFIAAIGFLALVVVVLRLLLRVRTRRQSGSV
jgi:hypothetical protein